MLIEIIIYMALFATIFSGAFSATFQAVDSARYLQMQKNNLDNLYFISSKLDYYLKSKIDWSNVTEINVLESVLGTEASVYYISSQIIETATSTSRVLILNLEINSKPYIFSYEQAK